MKRGKATAAAVVAIAAVAVAGCGGDGSGQTGTADASGGELDLTIGNLTTLTGDSAAFGPAAKKSSELAVEEVNRALQEAGLDATVSAQTYDTEGTSQGAQQAARKAIADGATCLTGPLLSSDVITLSESILRQQPVPIVAPGATNPDITTLEDDGYVYRMVPSDNLQARALAEVMREDLGGTPGVAVGARNETYGTGLADAFEREWTQAGGTIAGPVIWDPTRPTFNGEAAELVDGGSDAIVVFDFPETFSKVGSALLRTGAYDPHRLWTTEALAADTIPGGIPPAAIDGARGTRPTTPEKGGPVTAFNELYESAGGAAHYTFDAQTFDATMMCVLAAVAAGSTDPEAIRDQLTAVSGGPGPKHDFRQLGKALTALSSGEDIDFEGVSGPIDFDANGDPSVGTYELWTYRDGELESLRTFQVDAE